MNSAENKEFEEAFLAYLSEGSPEALKAFFDTSHRFIGQLCYRFFTDSADVEDVMQIFYIKIYENHANLCKKRDENNLLVIPWCITTVLNTAKKEFNRNKAIKLREKKSMKTEIKSEKRNERFIENNVLKMALNKLPEKYRLPIYLKYYEEQSYESIALSLGINQSTLRSILQRGLSKLRNSIKLISGIVLTEMVLIKKLQAAEFEIIKPESTSHIFNHLQETVIHVKRISCKATAKSLPHFHLYSIITLTLLILAPLFYFTSIYTTSTTTFNKKAQAFITEKVFKWDAKMSLASLKPLCNFSTNTDQNGNLLINDQIETPEIKFPFLRTSEYSYLRMYFKVNSGQGQFLLNSSVLPAERELGRFIAKEGGILNISSGSNLCEIIRYKQYSALLINGTVLCISKLKHEKEGMLISKYDVIGFGKIKNFTIMSIEYTLNSKEKHTIVDQFDELWQSNKFTLKE